MSTMLRFSQNIRSVASRIENNSAVLVKRVARKVLRQLVLTTPVDKGVARSNWRVSLGNTTRAAIPAYAPGHNLGIGETENATATIIAGYSVINRLPKTAWGPSAGKSLYITNNTPYIEKLNDGYSNQQPAGFIERASEVARREIGNFRLLQPQFDEND